MADKGSAQWHREHGHGGSAPSQTSAGRRFVLFGRPWLRQMVGIHPHRPPASSVPGQGGTENCCPRRICWKMWLQRFQTRTATASTIMERRQDFNSSSCGLLWLPAELDLGSPLLQPPRGAAAPAPKPGEGLPTQRLWVPGEGATRGASPVTTPAALQEGSQKDHVCPSHQVLAGSTPADAISCSGRCSVQCDSARPSPTLQVRSRRQDARSASGQSSLGSRAELRDKAGRSCN